MALDWFTFFAQIVNFVILVFLLKRLLFKPILLAIASRENLINLRETNAKIETEKALATQTEYQQKISLIEATQNQMLQTTTHEIHERRKNLLSETQHEIADFKRNSLIEMEQEEHSLRKSLTFLIRNEVYEISAKIVQEFSNTNIQEHIIKLFITHFSDWLKTKTTAQANEIKKIRCSHQLSKELQEQLITAIQKLCKTEETILLEVDPTLFIGISTSLSGSEVSWCARDFLESLEERTNYFWSAHSSNEKHQEERNTQIQTQETKANATGEQNDDERAS